MMAFFIVVFFMHANSFIDVYVNMNISIYICHFMLDLYAHPLMSFYYRSCRNALGMLFALHS